MASRNTLNLKVKYRNSFRPFAPAVLHEQVADWFELNADSPYMLLVAPVQKAHQRTMSEAERALFGIDKLNMPRSDIPAVTHFDYSARIQTVHMETNPRFHALISRFSALTSCPVVVNIEFQRPRLADRVHPGRCVSLLHGNGCFRSVIAFCAKMNRTPL
jgi:carbamoyltransferase